MKILNLKTYGLKNLSEPVQFAFANSLIDKGIKYDSNIKAIFGNNGAGKRKRGGSIFQNAVAV